MEKAAYHEIGHALAMYICYGNIDRISEIVIYCNGAGETVHDEDFYIADKAPLFDNSKKGYDFYFNEICYSMGGGLMEAIITHKDEFYSNMWEPIKMPRESMKGDYESMSTLLSIYGVTTKSEITAMARTATIFLQRAFIPYLDKVEELAQMLLSNSDYEGHITKSDFYRVMNPKLYRKERRRLRKKYRDEINRSK